MERMTSSRRPQEAEGIPDSLLHSCQIYIRGYAEDWPEDKLTKTANSICKLFRCKIVLGDEDLPWPEEYIFPSELLNGGDDTVHHDQMILWVEALYKTLRARKGGRYGV